LTKEHKYKETTHTEIGYYTYAKRIKTTLYSVTLEDGTEIKASNQP